MRTLDLYNVHKRPVSVIIIIMAKKNSGPTSEVIQFKKANDLFDAMQDLNYCDS